MRNLVLLFTAAVVIVAWVSFIFGWVVQRVGKEPIWKVMSIVLLVQVGLLTIIGVMDRITR